MDLPSNFEKCESEHNKHYDPYAENEDAECICEAEIPDFCICKGSGVNE